MLLIFAIFIYRFRYLFESFSIYFYLPHPTKTATDYFKVDFSPNKEKFNKSIDGVLKRTDSMLPHNFKDCNTFTKNFTIFYSIVCFNKF